MLPPWYAFSTAAVPGRLTPSVGGKAKNYVHDHLHEKISLTDVARLLHTNPNYISNLFGWCEGIPFTDFVLREKAALAWSLLVYSQLSCREIATSAGTSSASAA